MLNKVTHYTIYLISFKIQYLSLCSHSGEDSRMKFSLTPQPGESGFTQWLDAMKMVAGLPGGIPSEFRRRVSFI